MDDEQRQSSHSAEEQWRSIDEDDDRLDIPEAVEGAFFGDYSLTGVDAHVTVLPPTGNSSKMERVSGSLFLSSSIQRTFTDDLQVSRQPFNTTQCSLLKQGM